MRIGILTFHRAHNYGAVLQCYALQQYLISLGHDAYVIDYNKKELWAGYDWRDKVYERQILKKTIKFPFRYFRYIWGRRKQILRYYKFVFFQNHILRLSSIRSINRSPYDLILIGSDQVWNTNITMGLDPYYWGVFDRPSSTKVATYAASLRALWEEKDYKFIHHALQMLDGISVRESAVGQYVKNLFPDLMVSCVPDPVFLLPAHQWLSFAKIPAYKKPYAFFYQAERSEVVYNTACEISSKFGLPLIVLSADARARNSKECHSASPQEFIGWIQNADLVITSSFHALAFSIIFQKDFYAINLNKGKDERLNSILSLFGLEERLVDNVNMCKVMKPHYNTEAMNLLRTAACDFINQVIMK